LTILSRNFIELDKNARETDNVETVLSKSEQRNLRNDIEIYTFPKL